MSPSPSDPDPPATSRRPLPVTITAGMPVYIIEDSPPASVAGFTEACCIMRFHATDTLAVAGWRDVALGNVCPANVLLPADVVENDRLNAQAAVLRELLALQQFDLSAAQQAALDELVANLCSIPT